jgi:hypothetical protein
LFGVPRPNLDQIAVVARNMVYFEHFWELSERTGNLVIAGRFAALDRHERQHPLVNRAGIDLCHIATQDAAALQLAHPLQDGGRSQTDRSGNIDLGLTSICLKNAQNGHINVV